MGKEKLVNESRSSMSFVFMSTWENPLLKLRLTISMMKVRLIIAHNEQGFMQVGN